MYTVVLKPNSSGYSSGYMNGMSGMSVEGKKYTFEDVASVVTDSDAETLEFLDSDGDLIAGFPLSNVLFYYFTESLVN